DFFDGDIDRPVVIGSLYNGKGSADAQSNDVMMGAGVATGNAPAWFPGTAGAHAHPATLSGFKTQALSASQHGMGAFNQLVFDDTPNQARVALQRHGAAYKGTDELNLGHLRHQTDNQRLSPAGFGAELKTEHGMALRAGKGLLLSSEIRQGGKGGQLDASEAQAQIDSSAALQTSLATTAQKHNAVFTDGDQGREASPANLPAIAAMTASAAVIANATSEAGTTGSGGAGTAVAYSKPQMQLSGAAGIVASTPASALFCAGATSSITAGQDINFASQGNSHHLVAVGISLFTYGKATNPGKPNQETGIKLHAASGKASVQSQSGETRLTADKGITVTSVAKSVSVGARQHLLLTAQGAYIKLEGGNIMIHGPGKMEFKATQKELAGPKNATHEAASPPIGKLALCPFKLDEAGSSGASAM
ncbi:MAG: DUF2345 domain-containing protein, partial [Telluria sp.]